MVKHWPKSTAESHGQSEDCAGKKRKRNSNVWPRKEKSQQQLLKPKSMGCSGIQQHGWHELDLLHHKLMSPLGALSATVHESLQDLPFPSTESLHLLWLLLTQRFWYGTQEEGELGKPHTNIQIPCTSCSISLPHSTEWVKSDIPEFRLFQEKASPGKI